MLEADSMIDTKLRQLHFDYFQNETLQWMIIDVLQDGTFMSGQGWQPTERLQDGQIWLSLTGSLIVTRSKQNVCLLSFCKGILLGRNGLFDWAVRPAEKFSLSILGGCRIGPIAIRMLKNILVKEKEGWLKKGVVWLSEVKERNKARSVVGPIICVMYVNEQKAEEWMCGTSL